MYGAIEAGGTKFVCSIGNDSLEVIEQITIPTDSPDITMPQVIQFFEKYNNDLKAIGIGSFGPIDIDKNSPTYGYITQTPKLKWQNFNFIGTIKTALENVKVAWTTDVNASAYGEYTVRNNVESLVYYTVGTGIGGGAVQKGEFVQGTSHPEMGHVLVRRHEQDTFAGICPYHDDCLEGLASGPAVEARLGKKSQLVPPTDEYWDIQAYYIAQSAYNTTLLLAPEVIVYGGGVMKVNGLIDKVRSEFAKLNNRYIQTKKLDEYIVTPELGDNAATIGCLKLAQQTVR